MLLRSIPKSLVAKAQSSGDPACSCEKRAGHALWGTGRQTSKHGAHHLGPPPAIFGGCRRVQESTQRDDIRLI